MRVSGFVPGLGLFALLITFAGVQPSTAQNILKREPHYLAPGSIVHVDNGQCSAGKVMKVTGLTKGTSRRRTCVSVIDSYARVDAIEIMRR
ncbi:MAG: DUF6719 family protein [Xanthobacteraceae bacterium]